VFWRAAVLVAATVFSDAEPPARRLRPQVARLAAIWERRWNEALARPPPQDLAADEWGWLPRCDRAWANLVQAHLAPHGYSFLNSDLPDRNDVTLLRKTISQIIILVLEGLFVVSSGKPIQPFWKQRVSVGWWSRPTCELVQKFLGGKAAEQINSGRVANSPRHGHRESLREKTASRTEEVTLTPDRRRLRNIWRVLCHSRRLRESNPRAANTDNEH